MLTHRENYLRNARFQIPEWIPVTIGISDASWNLYGEEMENVCVRFPEYFPRVRPGWKKYNNKQASDDSCKRGSFSDAWGSVWEVSVDGLEGIVTNEVLDSWDKLAQYKAPDANIQLDRGPANWDKVERAIRGAKEKGELTGGGLAHGFLFLKILYLRGFTNAMMDFADDDPHLPELIDLIVEHYAVIVHRYASMGVDVMNFPDDLGTQTSTIINPKKLRKYIFPAYETLIRPCKKAGILVEMHSDGHTIEILEDQVRIGVDIVNPQDLCNGIDELANTIKGKACINLDVDRQTIVPYGTPRDIDDLIREEVMKLGSPAGGLSFIAGIYPPTAPENVEALCKAFRKYRGYWRE